MALCDLKFYILFIRGESPLRELYRLGKTERKHTVFKGCKR